MAKVFVVMDDGKKDLTDCLKFGDPVIIFKASFYPDTASGREPKVLRHALQILERYDDKNDFLVLVGDLALVAVCSAALVMLGKTKIRMLKYDRMKRDYYEITIDFTHVLGT